MPTLKGYKVSSRSENEIENSFINYNNNNNIAFFPKQVGVGFINYETK